MDIWVVAAAAGAGCVAQHCKNLVKGRQSFSDSCCESPNVRPKSSSITQQFKVNKSCPCCAVRNGQDEDICSDRESLSQVTSMAEKAPSSCVDHQNHVISSDYANSCTHSGSNVVPQITRREDVQGVGVCGSVHEYDEDISALHSTREMSVPYGFTRKRSRLRSRQTNRQLAKPVSSLESCLMAQLYKRQAEEEYAYASITPPCTPRVRPFPLTDGSGIINRSASDSFSLPIGSVKNNLHIPINSQDTRTIFGVPQLPSVGSIEFQRKGKTQMKMKQGRTLCNSIGVKGKHQKLQGTSDGALLFCLGLSIGLISSFLNNKQEVENLSDLLKQTESLVQDLQEELEMKDSLTVKELAVEDCESQDTQNDTFNNGPLHTFSPNVNLDDYENEYNTQKSEEDSFSKIEAELEAELERLELNMNLSGLERKMLNLSELDTDNVRYAVGGELKADVLGRQNGSQPYEDRDGSGSSTPLSVHYAVSPRELTLRLHEVIQSRLEQRVEELEIALQNSQMKVRCMESQNASYLRELSNRKSSCSSIKGSPVVKERSYADQPVVINLSGEALDAYNESYDESAKINELDEEGTPVAFNDGRQEKTLQPSDQKMDWLCNSEANNEIQVKSFDERLMLANQQEQGNDNYLSNSFLTSGDEDDNGYDEMEDILIKHIVEQARKGSPVVLNAQRALSSPDENEH